MTARPLVPASSSRAGADRAPFGRDVARAEGVVAAALLAVLTIAAGGAVPAAASAEPAPTSVSTSATGQSLSCASAAAAVSSNARAAGAELERLDRALAWSSPGGVLRTELSVLFDLEAYYVDQRPPGLIFEGPASFVNPRLSLFVDTHVGRHLYSLVQARIDRGFDPRSRSSGSARFDEYLLRYTPRDDASVNVQAGKFATLVGNWVARHDSWTNPFINAPLPYENVTTISDAAAPAGRDTFLERRAIPDSKYRWLPVVWGPSYASGLAAFGRLGRFDYGVEVKNAALASRPAVWDARSHGWHDPTVSGRLGWRPTAAWNVGVSASGGPYFRPKARATLPAGRDRDDFLEEVVAADLSYAWRHWQLWAELFLARFEVPRVGDADVASYYVESRYQVAPRLFAGLRWNQQLFGDVEDASGRERPWDRDMWRVDGVVGYRFDRHLQGKLQYGYSHQLGRRQQGEQLVAAQLTVKF